jgi:hypothetical protein
MSEGDDGGVEKKGEARRLLDLTLGFE